MDDHPGRQRRGGDRSGVRNGRRDGHPLRPRGARIIVGDVSCASSKGAVMPRARVLALEHVDRILRVNAICPGVIGTGMNRRNVELADDPGAERARWMSVTPLGWTGAPEEFPRTVPCLASDPSSFTTGIGLLIDGRRVAT